MMRIRLLLSALVVLALVPAGAADAASKPGKCSFKGSTTVAKNRYARVFTRPSHGGDEIERLYGCLYSANRRVWLDTSSDDGYVASQEFTDVVLDGRFVTWRHTSTDVSCKADCPPDYNPTSEQNMKADLRTRKVSTVPGP
jgi:hypothetical protein